ncbi:DUF2164 domain-containing protein [Chitinimonas sp. PSY-7]|uniref:DUF2164 family protein n=1 Tax=Chitinimonas sp. PSY-7 TaxID=3459088 RepID=UPI00403FEEB7
MSIKLEKRVEEALTSSLQRYFQTELEQPLGTLPAQHLLQFIVEEIGPNIYNQAVLDAQNHMQARVSDLNIDCYIEEQPYWNKKKKR